MDSASELPASPGFQPRHNFLTQLIRVLIQGNWFYVLSGIFMVMGCHQLVRSVLITGDEFIRTIISLGILQAYEVLVIATAVVIVQRLRILSDAFVLYLIEAALLLDPTFFSNSLGTMPDGRGLMVNLVCFALLPAKLIILQRMTGVRPSREGWLAFLFAGLLVYLAPWPMMAKQPALTLPGTYYALGLALVVLGLLLPPLRSFVSIVSASDDYATETQRTWLPRIVLMLPLIICTGHYLESSRVHTIPFFAAFAAPIFLMIAAVLAQNSHRERDNFALFVGMDFLFLFSIILSVPAFNVPDVISMSRPASFQPRLLLLPIPFAVVGVTGTALYILAWLRTRQKSLLYRLNAISAVCVAFAIWKSGVPGKGLRATERGIDWIARIVNTIGQFLSNNPNFILAGCVAAMIYAAIRKPHSVTWYIAGFFSIFLMFRILPVPEHGLVPEIIQSVMILGVIISHRFRPHHEQRARSFTLDSSPSSSSNAKPMLIAADPLAPATAAASSSL